MSEDFYSPVQRRIWNDAGFRRLSRPAPNARDLFLYLLTTPHATQVPGLIALGESAMAEDLGWPAAGLRKALVEVEAAGMVKVDRDARLLWLPNGLRHNPPRSPDNVKGWAKQWRMLPECALLADAAQAMMEAFVCRGPAFASAFARVSGLPVPEATPDPKPAAEPDPMVGPKQAPPPAPTPAHQDQDQEQEQQKKEIPPPLAGARAHEDRAKPSTVEVPPPSPLGVAIADAAVLLAAVARHPMLVTLHGDRRWAQNASSGFMSAAVRAGDVDAAVEAFVTGEAAKAPAHVEALATWVRDGIGRYLKKAKQHGDDARARAEREASRRRERPSEPRSADAQAVLETFGPVWAAKKRRPFVPATTDERHAAEVASRAQAAAPAGTPWPDVVRHWSEQHLASADRLVVDSDHALRTLGMNLTAYGLPRPKRERPLEPKPAAGETLVTIPREIATAMAQAPLEGLLARRPGGPS